ncbi:MAG TPA: ferritin family protein [Thermodesulfovibrionales bacterium]|nr:ferritin family protein [Thermodesulfovibrionales bacterium]
MDIFEFAMKMEKDGEGYYRELARKSATSGLSNIFTMLANAEVAHYEIFKKMKENKKATVTHTKILSQVKNVFETMKEEKKMEGAITESELYHKALEAEKRSREFYLSKEDEVNDTDQKKIFHTIADEEKKHYLILQEITDFVSRPETWLENPEWYHLEEY